MDLKGIRKKRKVTVDNYAMVLASSKLKEIEIDKDLKKKRFIELSKGKAIPHLNMIRFLFYHNKNAANKLRILPQKNIEMRYFGSSQKTT